MRFERVQGLLSERDDPQSVRSLAVGPKLAADQDAADVEYLRLSVDVASLQREQLGGAQAGQGADERDRPIVLEQLGGDGLDLGERCERQDLGPLRLRVRDRLPRVRVE